MYEKTNNMEPKMIETEYQKLQTSGKYNNFQFLKRTLQLVISFSVFSFVLCYSYGFSLFLHSFNVYFSTFLFSFFTHTLERKYMFIICNGILAFVAKSLVFCSSSSDETKTSLISLNQELPVVTVGPLQNVAVLDEEQQQQQKEEKNGEVKQEEAVAMEAEDQEQEMGFLYGDGNERESEDKEEEEEEEEEEVEPEAATNEDFASTEELNRKIEEFIRKMKEEIRIEAQQQLIAV